MWLHLLTLLYPTILQMHGAEMLCSLVQGRAKPKILPAGFSSAANAACDAGGGSKIGGAVPRQPSNDGGGQNAHNNGAPAAANISCMSYC